MSLEIRRPRGAFPGNQTAYRLAHPFPVLRGEEALAPAADHLLRTVSEHPVRRGAREENLPGRVDQGDEVEGMVREETVARLGGPQPLLHPPALEGRGENGSDGPRDAGILFPPFPGSAIPVEGEQADEAGAELQRGEKQGPHGMRFMEDPDRVIRRQGQDVVRRQDPVVAQIPERGIPAGVRAVQRPQIRPIPGTGEVMDLLAPVPLPVRDEIAGVDPAQAHDDPARLPEKLVHPEPQRADPGDPRHDRGGNLERRRLGAVSNPPAKRDRVPQCPFLRRGIFPDSPIIHERGGNVANKPVVSRSRGKTPAARQGDPFLVAGEKIPDSI